MNNIRRARTFLQLIFFVDPGLRRDEEEYSNVPPSWRRRPPSTKTKQHISFSPQRGAMFGLDARIALAIFSMIAVIAGAGMVLNISASQAKGLAAELTGTERALEAFHQDLQFDVFTVLEEPKSEARAYQALYDNTVITNFDNRKARWNGPYVNATSNRSPQWGEMSLQKRQGDATERCTGQELCFIWLVYSEVRPEVVREVNKIIDGDEADPGRMGRVQWQQDVDATQILSYRAIKALAWYDEF